MKSKLAWLGAFVLLALTMGATTSTATAAGPPDGGDACYEQITEYIYEHTYTETLQGDLIGKETHTVVGVEPDWITWNAWTAWPGADPVEDDGRDRGRAADNDVEPWTLGYREYRYVVVGQYDYESEPMTEQSGWTTENPYENGEQIDTRTVNGQEIPCQGPVPPTTPSAPTPPTASGQLPVTGSATGGLAAIAAALIAIGGMTWFATRRTS